MDKIISNKKYASRTDIIRHSISELLRVELNLTEEDLESIINVHQYNKLYQYCILCGRLLFFPQKPYNHKN